MDIGTHDYADQPGMGEGWVILPGGGIVPTKLDRQAGWLADEDRDSTLAARLRELVTSLDVLTADYVRGGVDPKDGADRMAQLWINIRKITQGRDVTKGDVA